MKKQIIGLAVCATILIGSAGMVEAERYSGRKRIQRRLIA